MCSLEHTSDMRNYSFLHYEQLKRISMSSVRIMNGRVERLIFTETEDGIQISLIEINKDRVTGYFLWVEVALSQYSEYSEHEERDIVDASQVCPKDFNL